MLQPLEALAPLIQNPGLAGGGRPLWIEALIKLKPMLMSVYFGADHVVWVQQVGAWLGLWQSHTECSRMAWLPAVRAVCLRQAGSTARHGTGRP